MGAGRGRLPGGALPGRDVQGPAGDDGGVLRLPQGRQGVAGDPANPRRRAVGQPIRGDHVREARLRGAFPQLGRQQDDVRRRQGLRRPEYGLGRARRHAPAATEQDQPLRRWHRARRLHARCGRFAAQRQLVHRVPRRAARPDVPGAPARGRPDQARRDGAFDGRTADDHGHGHRRARAGFRAFVRGFGRLRRRSGEDPRRDGDQAFGARPGDDFRKPVHRADQGPDAVVLADERFPRAPRHLRAYLAERPRRAARLGAVPALQPPACRRRQPDGDPVVRAAPQGQAHPAPPADADVGTRDARRRCGVHHHPRPEPAREGSQTVCLHRCPHAHAFLADDSRDRGRPGLARPRARARYARAALRFRQRGVRDPGGVPKDPDQPRRRTQRYLHRQFAPVVDDGRRAGGRGRARERAGGGHDRRRRARLAGLVSAELGEPDALVGVYPQGQGPALARAGRNEAQLRDQPRERHGRVRHAHPQCLGCLWAGHRRLCRVRAP